MKLSICMMVKDEEKNLNKCLKSLQPLMEVVDSELIIVDTGSKDNTVKIAKEYTDNIYFHNWNNNFSEMRNITISYAKGEWIFIIDGDEVLNDCSDIINFFNTKSYKEYNSAMLYVKNHADYEEKKLSAVLSSPRLFKNHTIMYEGSVHNSPVYKHPTVALNSLIKHYGYITDDKELMEKKFIRTSTLLKNELKRNPNNIYYRYQLSVSYNMHGDYEESLREIQQVYNSIKNHKDKMEKYIYIYNQLCRAYLAVNSYKDIEEICLEGIDIQPEYLDLYYYLGTVQIMYGKYDEAIKTYNEYINILENFHNTNISKDSGIIMYTLNDKETVFYNLAIAYYKKKDYEKAIQYTYFLENDKSVEKSLKIAIDCYVRLKKFEELYEYYLKFISKFNNKEDLFVKTLEENKLSYTIEESNYINKQFSKTDNIYGQLNNIRSLYIEQYNSINKYVLNFLTSYNFNFLPCFYGDIIYMAIKNNLPIENVIIELSENKIAEFLDYIANNYNNFERDIYNYINNFEFNGSIECIKTKMVLARTFLLLIHEENSGEVKLIFDQYTDNGILYMQSIYSKTVFDKELINELKNQSEKFLLYIYLANKVKENNDEKYIKYLKKALSIYPYMKDGIKLLFNDIEEKEDSANNEMEKFKNQVKENIKTMIEVGNLQRAKDLVSEYEKVVKGDIDIYSIKAIISMMEENIGGAENILKGALEKEPYNEDLLLNMSYLKDSNRKDKQALEYFCKAKLFNPDSNIRIQDIITNTKSIDNNNLKVLHGTMEIANQMNIMSSGLKKIGINAKTLNYYPNYLRYKSDYILNINSFKDINEANIETKKLASKVIGENDVFHFHFGTSLTLDYSDLPLLKELGKKVVMQYWGSDVRMYSKAIKLNPYVKVKDMNEDGIKRRLEVISKYIPSCIVDYELAEYVKDYHSNVYYTKVAIDLSKYKFIKKTHNNKLLIVHAPTSPEIKGSSYILKAIEELKVKYDFDFELVQGMSHEQAIKIYRKADIIIDQILGGGYGVFAVESMAMGKPVICWISDFMKEKYPIELPIICANPDNIKEKIEYAIKNKDMLEEIGIKGRRYAEKYHDMNNISKNMLEIYKNL